MPSTRKSSAATKTLTTPQNFKAKSCQKDLSKNQVKLHITGQCQMFVNNPAGTIQKDLQNTPLKQNEAPVSSSSGTEQQTRMIGYHNMVRSTNQEFIKMRNGKLFVYTSSTVPKPKELPQLATQPTLQHIHIVRGTDNRVIVSGLHNNQRLIKLPNGKLHVLNISPVPVTTDTKPILILQQPAIYKLLPNVVQPDRKTNVSPEALTESQLLEAMSYLIRNDTDFVKKLHEAYLKSFAEKASK